MSHWTHDFPHVFKYQVVPYTKDYRSESRDRLLSAVCDLLGLEKPVPGKGRAQSPVALLPPQVPKLPTGYRARDGIVEDIKCFLRGRDQNASQPRTLVAVGMGGSGKSVFCAYTQTFAKNR